MCTYPYIMNDSVQPCRILSINGIVLDTVCIFESCINLSSSFHTTPNTWYVFWGTKKWKGTVASFGVLVTIKPFFETCKQWNRFPMQFVGRDQQNLSWWLLTARRSTNSLTKSRMMRKQQHHLQKRRLESEPQVVNPRFIWGPSAKARRRDSAATFQADNSELRKPETTKKM